MGLPTRIGKKFWMKEVDEWMFEKGQPTMNWFEIVRAEGGYGKDFSEDKELDLFTHPGRWFGSGQTDFDLYSEYGYVYSLLFGALQISGQVYRDFAQRSLGKAINDVGGSIFTAAILLKYGIEAVNISNVSDSPQLEFAQHIIKKFDLPVSVGSERPDAGCILSEYLEHFYEPTVELERVLDAVKPKSAVALSSSFCMPAYGHFIPIFINGAEHATPRAANKAFINYIEAKGWPLARIGLFNKGYLITGF